MEKPIGGSNCCVVGCSNAFYKTDTSVKFYRFPGRWYEKERRDIWINSVRRLTADKKHLWKPKAHDRICSAHFVGNSKSAHPQSPAYNPTIFPKEYMKMNYSQTTDTGIEQAPGQARLNRRLNREAAKEELLNSEATKEEQLNRKATKEEQVHMQIDDEKFLASVAEELLFVSYCQVDFPEKFSERDIFIFESTFERTTESKKEVSTQVTISEDNCQKWFKRREEKCVGNDDNIECVGFHGYKSIKCEDGLNSLAGLTFDRFALLLTFLTSMRHGNSKLTIENKLLLFLMKMKLGVSNSTLGVLFQLHRSTCSRIFTSVLNILVQKMKNFVFWPSRNTIDLTMPKTFKINYPRCRVIIDCTEIKIQQPAKVDKRIYTYSNYKSAFTAKVLIGISPTGFVSFVSSCYGGRSSDTFITNDCGILELLEPNDVVLADKGFPGIKCKDDVVLVLPPFVHDGRLSYEEVEETYTIASVRIHVERSIQRIKIYNILQKINFNLFPYLDDIVKMCCILTNLQPPTMKLEEDD